MSGIDATARAGAAPHATVVVPSRDRPDLARRTVLSLLAQQGCSVHVIVIDDGSKVPLSSVLADLEEQACGRLQVLRERGRGVAAARSVGLEAVRSPWVGFCDDDDLWAPSKVATQIAVAAREDAEWTVSAAVTVDPRLEVKYLMRAPRPERLLHDLLTINVMPGGASSVLARTELVRAAGGWDRSLSTLADWDMWIRLAEAAPLAVVEEPLTAYMLNGAGMSLDTSLLEHDLGRLVAKRRRGPGQPLVLDRIRWFDYLSYVNLRAGRRLRAARASMRSFMAGAPPQRLGKAVVSIVDPSIAVRRFERRQRARSPWGALQRADLWIAPYRKGLAEMVDTAT